MSIATSTELSHSNPYPFDPSMTRYIDIPARDHLPAASLFARISTPHNRAAKSVDPDFPTLLLCHPLWTDSFIL